jgi:zinc protease
VHREAERLMQLPPIRILKATWDHSYPAAHPYAGFDIASDDLNRATLADARRFYARYYHPTNAVLVVAGDVDAQLMRDRVNRYFGAIATGPRPERRRAGIGRRSGTIRKRVEGAVDDARLRFVWNTPGWGTHAADHLGLAATTIASRMTNKLKASGLATEVEATMEMRELGGQIMLDVLATSSAAFRDIENSLGEEIRRLATEGVTAEELEQSKTTRRRQFQQEAAGLAGKTYLLGRAELFAGDPGHIDVMQRRTLGARPEDVRLAVRQWLTDGLFVLELTG